MKINFFNTSPELKKLRTKAAKREIESDVFVLGLREETPPFATHINVGAYALQRQQT